MSATDVTPTIEELIEKLPDYGTERPHEDAIRAAPTQLEKEELIEPLAEAYWQLHPDGGRNRNRSTFWKLVNTTRPQTPKARVAKLDGQTYTPSEDVEWYKPWTGKLDGRVRALKVRLGSNTSVVQTVPVPAAAQHQGFWPPGPPPPFLGLQEVMNKLHAVEHQGLNAHARTQQLFDQTLHQLKEISERLSVVEEELVRARGTARVPTQKRQVSGTDWTDCTNFTEYHWTA